MQAFKPSMAERRRSVDTGGLALALGSNSDGHSSGSGWGGWDENDPLRAADDDSSVRYAETLVDMYVTMRTTVDNIANFKDLPTNEKLPGNRQRLIDSLDTWHFEPHKLSEDAALACTILLFEALLRTENMVEDIGMDMDRVDPFLRHLRGVYRQENSYHNFQHALDVLQATHMFLSAAGVVPPVSLLAHLDGRKWTPDRTGASSLVASLTNADLFALYIAAIGHDAGHPGFSNVFMKNAQTPLSAVYSDRSALEQMHCALLLQVMRHNGMAKLLDAPKKGPRFRHLLLQTILATDMSVHGQFMSDFESLLVAPPGAPSSSIPKPASDKQKLLVCQALIKCADISNPCRPRGVARHWANALVAEWTAQAALEKALRLPSTVNPSAEPIAEAKSQVFFISTFAGPLFNLTTKGIPELSPYSREGASNLEWWRARLDRLLLGHEPATPPTASSALPPAPVREEEDEDTTSTFATAFPLTLPPTLRISEPEMPMSPLQAAFNAVSLSPTSTSTIDDIPSSPTMPGAFISTPPTLARSLSSPPSSPSSSRTSGSSTGPGRLHIATNLPNVGSGPLPTPPPDGPSNLLTTHPHATHTRTNSAASATSAVSSTFSAASTAGTGAADPALRSAWKASMRKKSSQHFHRASWNPTTAAIPPLPPQALLAGASSVVSSVTTSPNPSNHSSPVFSTTIFNKTFDKARPQGREADTVGNGSG